MATFDEIADDLPAPRDDEPVSLRQDIVDELSDHLSCAVNRELHRGNDELKARQNAIERFGNPARIAYRLWFDAMKEKIMSQRITLTAAIVVAVACLFVAGMAWQMSQQSRETNLALLDKLSALAAQQEQHKSLDWNPVKIKLVSGDNNGPPASGIKANLSSSEKSMPPLEEVSGDDGVVDFGQVRYGQYSLSLTSPWGEGIMTNFLVRPGKAISKTIVCPSKPEPTEIAIEIDWPEDFKHAELWAFGDFKFQSDSPRDPGLSWNFSFGSMGPRSLLLVNSGKVIDCGPNRNYAYDTLEELIGEGKPASTIHGMARPLTLRSLHIIREPGTTPDEPRSTPDGKLNLPKESVASYYFRPSANSRDGGFGSGGGFFGGPAPNFGLIIKEPPAESTESSAKRPKPLESPTFEPKSGQPNRWKITLPDELLAHLRKPSPVIDRGGSLLGK